MGNFLKGEVGIAVIQAVKMSFLHLSTKRTIKKTNFVLRKAALVAKEIVSIKFPPFPKIYGCIY